ncbi:MAG: eL32 family ribosomal protein [Candidatus Rehaiarchaeum fermentans]|nr:50S ribosomal protein L32e [Candidatus Rehaiarchaeum fermentans]MCW1293119.1 50S ribosomal protein L32e [Candidatus Rehaiarchaeum fermentans]MCW1293690.1 50S ribosomal protein L32e [Candidatus Rehaiarchaeum fermentans]MCW1297242.1 50S ribosomal protein L32e [Candidatus Rehaiarchaeum fermentans]MCW1302264.1 50S ribosomal protein L32e [Candidatus Rehaiarchaeum fermentans]
MSKDFKRRDSSKLKRLGDKWRRPKSRRNWTRVKARGRPRIVEKGYRTPKSSRGRIDGKLPVLIHSINELEKINSQDNIVIIGGDVGAKKRKLIVEECNKRGIKVYNL